MNAKNGSVEAYNYGDAALNQWENYIPQNRSGYLDGLALFRKKVSEAISTLPEPLPPNYQTSIRPLAGAVRIQMQHFFEWTSNVRTIAGSKIGRLEIMSHKSVYSS